MQQQQGQHGKQRQLRPVPTLQQQQQNQDQQQQENWQQSGNEDSGAALPRPFPQHTTSNFSKIFHPPPPSSKRPTIAHYASASSSSSLPSSRMSGAAVSFLSSFTAKSRTMGRSGRATAKESLLSGQAQLGFSRLDSPSAHRTRGWGRATGGRVDLRAMEGLLSFRLVWLLGLVWLCRRTL
jgi:hypothetical protein